MPGFGLLEAEVRQIGDQLKTKTKEGVSDGIAEGVTRVNEKYGMALATVAVALGIVSVTGLALLWLNYARLGKCCPR